MSTGTKVFIGLALAGLIYFAYTQSKKAPKAPKPMVINNRI